MNRFALNSVIVAAFAALSVTAHAADVSQTFTVKASLAAKCIADTVTAAKEIVIPEYTAYGAAKSNSTDIAFKCSKGLTPADVSFDTGGDSGTLKGLNYTLTLSAATVTANSDTAVGGDVRTYSVTASMAAGQAGDTTDTTTSKTHTLKVTF